MLFISYGIFQLTLFLDATKKKRNRLSSLFRSSVSRFVLALFLLVLMLSVIAAACKPTSESSFF